MEGTKRSIGLLGHAATTLLRRPAHQAALVAALVVKSVVEPLWGSALTWGGWLAARERMRADGLVALGDVLAPSRARRLYGDGVWRGLWRVHGLSLALAVIELPLALLAFLPAILAALLLKPAALAFHSPAVGQLLAIGVPALVGLVCAVVVWAQLMLVWRLLGEAQGDYSLGLVFRAVGTAWRATLEQLGVLVLLGGELALMGLVGGALVYGTQWGAMKLDLGAGTLLVTLWTVAAVAFVVVALAVEALAEWADDLDLQVAAQEADYSFTRWLQGWLGAVRDWFVARGFAGIGAAVCLGIGVLTALAALATGQLFTSWVGLGWFAASAAVLVVLHVTGRRP